MTIPNPTIVDGSVLQIPATSIAVGVKEAAVLGNDIIAFPAIPMEFSIQTITLSPGADEISFPAIAVDFSIGQPGVVDVEEGGLTCTMDLYEALECDLSLEASEPTLHADLDLEEALTLTTELTAP